MPRGYRFLKENGTQDPSLRVRGSTEKVVGIADENFRAPSLSRCRCPLPTNRLGEQEPVTVRPLREQELATVNPLGKTRADVAEGKGATVKLSWGAGESTEDEAVACGTVSTSASRSPLGYEDRRYFFLEPPLLLSLCLKYVLFLLRV